MRAVAFVVVSFAALPTTAAAEVATAPYVAPPPPAPEAPPVENARGVHEHDGFYLGIAVGMSYLHDSVQADWLDSASYSGFGLADKIAIGGTIARGLVLGGAIEDSSAFSPTLIVDGKRRSSPHQLGLSLLGPFLDYYIDPAQGLHMGALLGLSVLTADDDKDLPVGFGGSLSAGYEWWIGKQSSLGLIARLAYARATFHGVKGGEVHSVLAPAILLQYAYQ